MLGNTFYIESLGCAKNLVDSESMRQLLYAAGFWSTDSPSSADIIIVNTCGFIEIARRESIEVLNQLAAKKKKRSQILIAAGCLSQRDSQYIARHTSGVDGIIGTRRWMDIVDFVRRLQSQRPKGTMLCHQPPYSAAAVSDEGGVQRAAVQGGSAYLKIADGCRRNCAFCSIPLIKGSAASRPPAAIFKDARLLQQNGIKELIIIAQDTTDYGTDLGLKDGLAVLLEEISAAVPHIPWIRLMYTYPGFVSDRLVQVMAQNRRILPYLDMPLQHAHPQVLKRMKRPADMDWVYRTIEKMRSALPGLALRSTFIVGYPGESEEQFQTLLDFLAEMRFDHVGAFTFSFERGTASEALGDPIPAEVKAERLQRLMLLQEQISLSINRSFVGKTLQVLVEGSLHGVSVGRSYRDAPEIDGLVIAAGDAPAGELVKVRIRSAMPHDLSGDIIMPRRTVSRRRPSL